MFGPLVSIGIPAYKKPAYVVRGLQSILQQSYKNIEIIISDDSPDESIKIAIEPYISELAIKYYHNQPALTSPANWNAALDKSSGELKLLLHQDDWFHDPDAIKTYVTAFEDNPEVDFVFCQNTAIEETGKKVILQARPSLLHTMSKNPNHLLLAQVIGPPSNTMLRSRVNTRYDEKFIWLVDVDYYVRILKKGHKYKYIQKHLVSIGIHEDQTTVFCRTNDTIILKENTWFANKLEKEAFKDILIYDYYWRLLRNYNVRTTEDLARAGVEYKDIPPIIVQMLSLQQKLSPSILKMGLLSKFFMMISYLTAKKN